MVLYERQELLIYRPCAADPKRVIIYRPGLVFASSYALADIARPVVGVRNSCIDPGAVVLDVADPLVSLWTEESSGLIVIDGHHRLAHASCKKVGVEARLVECVENLGLLPDQCFPTVSRKEIADFMPYISQCRSVAISNGVDRVEDLV